MARILTHVVTFRLPAVTYGKLLALRATFAESQWGVMFRWMIEQPEFEAMLKRRNADLGTDRPLSGIEASLPAGDR